MLFHVKPIVIEEKGESIRIVQNTKHNKKSQKPSLHSKSSKVIMVDVVLPQGTPFVYLFDLYFSLFESSSSRGPAH